VGRIIFNECFPPAIGFRNYVVDKSSLKKIVADCSRILNDEEMAGVMDRIKETGFLYATRSGTTIAMGDIQVPEAKAKLIADAEARTAEIERQYEMGVITDDERYGEVVKIWNETTDKVTEATRQSLDPFSGIYMMATSGAKGNMTQIRQMAGMRGLMTNPSGKIIDFPIKASFTEGLSVLEYFISTHGARKGLADTALRTSESGYLTRRLVDVAHDVIIREIDCGTTDGLWLSETKEKDLLPSLTERIMGRLAAANVTDPATGEIIVARDEEIDDRIAARIVAAGIKQVYVRTPMTCQAKRGVCQKCYGRDLARGHLIAYNTAVGIIAAQSIGEPGTQLTLRTFHTGGVVGLDITTGLPRVEELFEARTPKNQAVISEISGVVEIIETDERQTMKVTSSEMFRDEHQLPPGWKQTVPNGQWVEMGTVIAGPAPQKPAKKRKAAAKETQAVAPAEGQALVAQEAGTVVVEGDKISIVYEEKDERVYNVSPSTRLRVQNGEKVTAGHQLTEGQLNPQDILNVSGKEAVQRYLVNEVQKVYRSQGVNINDKHVEIIVRQMLAKVRTDSSGDTELVPGELANRFKFEEINAKVLAEGGEAAVAHPVLLGITRAALSTESWLAAASFQETTKVLTEAAIKRATDRLVGLKENVIIGRLIPARYKTDEEMVTVPPEIKARLEEETELDADMGLLGDDTDLVP
jgi:DNA-directed RNA polymerase subunit beta'